MILLIVHLLSFISVIVLVVKFHDSRGDDTLITIVMVLASAIPVLSQVIVLMVIFVLVKDSYDTRKDNRIKYNKIHECSSCGLYSRKGYIDLHKLNTGKNVCPSCESERTMNETKLDINTELPLSPKFTSKQIKELEKMKLYKEKNKLIDDQLEKYLALQEKKLSKTYDEALSKLNELKQNKL